MYYDITQNSSPEINKVIHKPIKISSTYKGFKWINLWIMWKTRINKEKAGFLCPCLHLLPSCFLVIGLYGFLC